MLSHGAAYLDEKFGTISRVPLYGHIELTYRCDYHCVHCCCQGSENIGRELSTEEIKKILDQVQKEGCLWLAISGGDPLIRPDFREVYAYAKEKGFLITLLTNGYRLNRRLIDFLAQCPPLSIDITLNSLSPANYARITGFSSRALDKVKDNIRYASGKGLSVIIKANAMKSNKDRIHEIKRWAHGLPSKSKEKLYNFRYDPILYPRLNGDTSPCRLRLDAEELDALYASDPDITKDHRDHLKKKFPSCRVPNDSLYYCNTYLDHFFIDPFGRLRFCMNTDKFSVDLRRVPFARGFHKEFSKVARVKFKTDSICRTCRLRKVCLSCPAAAFLEHGDEEVPVAYFCQLAHRTVAAAKKHKECREK
jgi:radical SAM protein with 4Fe4S-binding SPASM domain